MHSKTCKSFLIFLMALMLSAPVLRAQVRVEVDATDKQAPVSRLLYGKFTEHLGNNVYLGAWAQIVRNPEFVPASRWPDRDNQRPVEEALDRASQLFRLPALKKDARSGVAAFWSSSGNISASLHKEGITDYQRLKTGEEGGSMMTGIFPPLHRTSGYQLRLKARSKSVARIKISVLNMKRGRVGEIGIIVTGNWATQELVMHIDDPGHQPGSPYLLRLESEPGSTVDLARILLFPDDHIDGWEPEVVEMVRKAKLPLLRYPGGNFASGYHWRDGVGPLDERPVLPNPAWPIVEWNHVGNDEWMRFCHLIDAEPMVCVNAGNGTPREAAEWVRYCNEPPTGEMGKIRAANGHVEPYKIRWWEVGNELSGPWQVGHTDAEGYAERYARFEKPLREADPDILLVANGQLRVLQADKIIDRGGQNDWNERLVEENGEKVRSISVHSLAGGHLREPEDPQGVWKDLLAYADHYPQFLDELVVRHMKDAGLKPVMAITELQAFAKHPALPKANNIGGTLWYSGMLNQCIRSGGLIELITHSALLNHGGGLRKARGVVFADPVWWTTYMYSTQEGTIPVAVKTDSPVFSSSGKYIVKRENIPYLDVMALLAPDGQTCTVILANRQESSAMDVEVSLAGFQGDGEVEVMQVQADQFDLRNTWDKPGRIAPEIMTLTMVDELLKTRLPPLSLTRLVMRAKN